MKTFLPPLVAFMVFAVIVIFQSLIHPMHVGDMGGGNLHAFMACFYFCWPLYFITALLTQWLIIVPVRDGFVVRSALSALGAFIITCLICTGSAATVAYMIWDKSTGFAHFVSLALLMYFIQMAYWVIDFFVLFLFSSPAKPAPPAEEAAA